MSLSTSPRRATAAFLGMIAGLSFGVAAHADSASRPSLRLALPIACTPGKDCWLVNLVDHDPAQRKVQDYTCLGRTYDGHKGTDIAIRDLAAMEKGVPVLASAAGSVRAVRDGMRDISVSLIGPAAVEGKECGNAVILDHGNGWQTQYCHLRKGSLAVKRGQRVKAGEKLGLVGNSGRAEFPHVHLSLRRNKRVVDPFVGLQRTAACAAGPDPIWSAEAAKALDQPLTALYTAGFSAETPLARKIRRGVYKDTVLSRRAPKLIFWFDAFNVRKGDRVEVRVTDGEDRVVVTHRSLLKKTQARRYFFTGKKRKKLMWEGGTYTGVATLLRRDGDGRETRFQIERRVELK